MEDFYLSFDCFFAADLIKFSLLIDLNRNFFISPPMISNSDFCIGSLTDGLAYNVIFFEFSSKITNQFALSLILGIIGFYWGHSGQHPIIFVIRFQKLYLIAFVYISRLLDTSCIPLMHRSGFFLRDRKQIIDVPLCHESAGGCVLDSGCSGCEWYILGVFPGSVEVEFLEGVYKLVGG